MTRSRSELALRGEELAAKHLESAGWRIAGRRVRTRHGEIDIVATRRDVVAFVEVKTRTSERFGRPAESIDVRKAERLRRAAIHLHQSRRDLAALRPRLDVIEVVAPAAGGAELVHLEGAIET